MQIFARTLTRFIRPSTAKSWVPSHPNLSASICSLGTSGDETPEWPRPKEVPEIEKGGSSSDDSNNFRVPIADTATCGDQIHVNGQINVQEKPSFPLGFGPIIQWPDHWTHLIEKPDDWIDFRLKKQNGRMSYKFPDFKRKDGIVALWLYRAPIEIIFKLKDVNVPTEEDHHWIDLVKNKDNWRDIRFTKKNVKSPDFVHRETRVCLWLKDLPSSLSKFHEVFPDHWSRLIEKPDDWIDFRLKKQNGTKSSKFPDFMKKDGTVALWVDSAPIEIMSKLKDVNIPTEEHLWKDLIENTHNWWDLRMTKKSVKVPDFVHRETRQRLWLSDCPSWMLSKLPPLESE